MNRRNFSKSSLLIGLGALAGCNINRDAKLSISENTYREPDKNLPVRRFDVVVAGGGTAGVVAAIAAARTGANVMLIESKGYTGGTVVEGGTALHSFYNLWKPFPGTKKTQVVRGIPQEIIERLIKVDGTTGHVEMTKGSEFDSICTAIDTELYKLTTMEMLAEAGVFLALNTLLTGAITEGSKIVGAITESRSGREAILAHSFIDCTAYGDLSAFAGAEYTEPNDYSVCNSIGLANVDLDDYYAYLQKYNTVSQYAEGTRSGNANQIVRLSGNVVDLPPEFADEAQEIGMALTTTSVHNNYLMFIKLNMMLPESPTNRDAVAEAELQLRQRQFRAVELFKKYVPGCEDAFMARTSPSLNIRRGRTITCDYDISNDEIINGVHFEDDIMVYGFHDMAPKYQVKNGGTYGIPYRALLVKGIDNLFVSGMMITSSQDAHMSTRNTLCCMGQGQATGTAAAICAKLSASSRELPYEKLREQLEKDGVYFES